MKQATMGPVRHKYLVSAEHLLSESPDEIALHIPPNTRESFPIEFPDPKKQRKQCSKELRTEILARIAGNDQFTYEFSSWKLTLRQLLRAIRVHADLEVHVSLQQPQYPAYLVVRQSAQQARRTADQKSPTFGERLPNGLALDCNL